MEINATHDADLWNRFRKGNDNALSEIYSRNAGKLYRYGLKFTKNHSIIEDAIQELFLELIRNRRTLGFTDNILAYLLTSFRRKLFRQLKREDRYFVQEEGDDYRFEVTYSVEHELILEEISDERKRLYSLILQHLKPRQKEAVYLKYSVGLPYEEISAIMEMNVESCRNLIYRAIRAVRESTEREGKPGEPGRETE